ncbi:MAG TPA: DUF4338 domain-containing protein [Spirochaetales bacterium]|nr:DUF4338 domain-containing protein [Spirochaetales bacterium]
MLQQSYSSVSLSRICPPDIGTTYKASNWILLGKTKGLGKLSKTRSVNRSLKDVYGYPLSKYFREILCR